MNMKKILYCAIQTIFYWRLYPKLAQKQIIPKRVVMDVHG